MNIQFLITAAAILFLNTASPQTPDKTGTHHIYYETSCDSQSIINPIRIKWIRQLPPAVQHAFNKSNCGNWFIEKIIRYNANNKTVYKLYVNNSNLLDGDHLDSFLANTCLDFTDDGTNLHN